MSFDPSPISNPTLARDGDMMVVAWQSSAAAGSTYQVYLDRALAYHGTMLTCTLPWPSSAVWVDIGVVPAADADTDYGSTLTGGSSERAELFWMGGTYLSPTISSYNIYSSLVPGGAVSYVKPIDSVPAYDGGFQDDGYGLGGYGDGGYGESAAQYQWTSGILRPGVWTFGVCGVDEAGNIGSPVTTVVSITGPPNPPGVNTATYSRAPTYTYNQSTRIAVISWLASPP